MQDLRHWIGFWVQEVTHLLTHALSNSTVTVKHFVESLADQTQLILGWIPQANGWAWARNTKKHIQAYEALMHYASNSLRLPNCTAVRVARGVRTLTAMPGFVNSIIVWWSSGGHHKTEIIEAGIGEKLNLAQLLGREHRDACIMQFLIAHDDTANMTKPILEEESHAGEDRQVNSAEPSSPTGQDGHSPPSGELSPITEGTAEDEDYLVHDDPAAQDVLQYVMEEINGDQVSQKRAFSYKHTVGRSENRFPPEQCDHDLFVVPNYHRIVGNVWRSVDAAGTSKSLPADYQLEVESDEPLELEFQGSSYKLLTDLPRVPGPGEIAVMQVFLAGGGLKRAVIQRDTDVLTPEEMRTHSEEIQASYFRS